MSDNPGLPVVSGQGVPVFEIRGQRVVLDRDVAAAFGVETKRVNEARARNATKFAGEHAFQLSDEEHERLRSQIATSNDGRGGSRYAPWVYTVKGVGRLAMILDTPQALAASDQILDTFIEVLGTRNAVRFVRFANRAFVARNTLRFVRFAERSSPLHVLR